MAIHTAGSMKLRRMQGQPGAPLHSGPGFRRPCMRSEPGMGGGGSTATAELPEKATPREMAFSLMKGEEQKEMLDRGWATLDEMANAEDFKKSSRWKLGEEALEGGFLGLRKLRKKGEITGEQHRAVTHLQLYRNALGIPTKKTGAFWKAMGIGAASAALDLIYRSGSSFGPEKHGIATSTGQGAAQVVQDAHSLTTSEAVTASAGAIAAAYILYRYGVRGWAGMQGSPEAKTNAGFSIARGLSSAGMAFGLFRSLPTMFTGFPNELHDALSAIHDPNLLEQARATLDVASQNAPLFTWSALAFAGIYVLDKAGRPMLNRLTKALF